MLPSDVFLQGRPGCRFWEEDCRGGSLFSPVPVKGGPMHGGWITWMGSGGAGVLQGNMTVSSPRSKLCLWKAVTIAHRVVLGFKWDDKALTAAQGVWKRSGKSIVTVGAALALVPFNTWKLVVCQAFSVQVHGPQPLTDVVQNTKIREKSAYKPLQREDCIRRLSRFTPERLYLRIIISSPLYQEEKHGAEAWNRKYIQM